MLPKVLKIGDILYIEWPHDPPLMKSDRINTFTGQVAYIETDGDNMTIGFAYSDFTLNRVSGRFFASSNDQDPVISIERKVLNFG